MLVRFVKPLWPAVVAIIIALAPIHAPAQTPKPASPPQGQATQAAAQQDMPASAAGKESTAPENDPSQPPEIIALTIGVPEIDAKSYLLVDFQSGEELAGINPGLKVEPASITKLMTAYLVYQALDKGEVKLEDEVLISERAWKMDGSRMFVDIGKRVPLEKLLKGMIIQSGNDAAVALAEHVAGTEEAFVERMNQMAAQLGMKDTQYQNVTGWPAKGHYTTARDIVKLASALIRDFPERYKLYAEKEFLFNNIKQQNRNRLLWRDPTVDGLKTGHTESAGYCLVASAKRDNMRLISVVLGAKSEDARADSSQALLEYGFRTFETHKLFDAGSALTKAKVWKGEATEVPAGITQDLIVTIPKGRYDHLKGSIQVDRGIDAPLKRGDVLGKVMITDEETGKVMKEAPLLALQDVAAGGWWQYLRDTVAKWFAD